MAGDTTVEMSHTSKECKMAVPYEIERNRKDE